MCPKQNMKNVANQQISKKIIAAHYAREFKEKEIS